ncbi:GNAT family N-acetyltransferase [Paenibacillus kobensis]|uniref:GNAT family N-acetyltransferase n=1 Tax=Paenibacillus kobensis TaxID=59841 RepID=UPI000FDA468F|nr:GNAT family N-acetyltransferase [Paenibacillus kobensis]
MTIRARSPHSDDAPILQLIRDEIIPFSYLYSLQDAPSQKELRARLDMGATYVASYSTTNYPYGFVHAIAQGEVLYVDLLAVHPTCRKRGVGANLMERAEQYGMASGCREALLFVDESNDAAVRFYEKLGYRVTGFADKFRCHEMRKPFVRLASRSRRLARRS